MPVVTSPLEIRDIRMGIYRKSAISDYLVPANSTQSSTNVNYDTIIGKGVVRPGTTLLGAVVAANRTPLGLSEFVGSGGTPNLLLAVFSGASTASVYYFDTAWHTSTLTTQSNTSKSRFAQLGNRAFIVNGTNPMLSSADGNIWNTTNCIITDSVVPSLIYRYKGRLLAAGNSAFRDRVYFSSIIDPAIVSKSAAITRSGSTATATVTAHGYVTNDFVTISGANQVEYNGTFKVTVTGVDTFTFSVSGAPATPATGTVIAFPATLTWNTDPSTGDWIDVNPDDGSNVTGFSETSTLVLVFKLNGMYRMDTVSKTVDLENIFNIGAVSQESIVLCQGVTYFYSGYDIRRTNGGYPEQISRAGVQDFLDAIPQANQTAVCAGTDGLNVYFHIGDVTINTAQNGQTTFSRVTLKFSPRDQTWSIHSYGQSHKFYAQYTTSANGRKMMTSDTTGSVQTVNLGTTDNTVNISYDLELQEQDVGMRSHLKTLSDQIVVFTNHGIDSQIQVKADDEDYRTIHMSLDNRVNVGNFGDMGVNSSGVIGHYFTFRWFGTSKGTPPVFEGIYIEKVTDQGIVQNGN